MNDSHHHLLAASDPAAPVHIWWSRTDVPPVQVWRLFQTLSDDERARSHAAVSSAAFTRFVCARGQLREILSTYTGALPEQLAIEHGRSGKPYLISSDDDLRFSLAHSGDLAVFAVAWGSDVGVDLEQIAPRHADTDHWGNALTARELHELTQLPDTHRPRAFAQAWTRKEAVLKATGRGLTYPITRLELAEPVGDGATAVELDGLWHVRGVPAPDPDFVAALATRTASPRLLARYPDDSTPYPNRSIT